MASHTDPEIVLYDLACIKNVCFSPVVWRIRLMLNYKEIPYKTVFLEFPDIEPTLTGLGITKPESASKYTVPTIHHLPTNTYIMDSAPISQFLESTYPSPSLLLTSPLGSEIETKARAAISPALRTSMVPREPAILSPRSQEYFRSSREAALGHPLEDLLEYEEAGWRAVDEEMRKVGELMRTHAAEGPFVLGRDPTYTDFLIAGFLQCSRVVSEEKIWMRLVAYPGFKDIYEACLPWMEKKD